MQLRQPKNVVEVFLQCIAHSSTKILSSYVLAHLHEQKGLIHTEWFTLTFISGRKGGLVSE